MTEKTTMLDEVNAALGDVVAPAAEEEEIETPEAEEGGETEGRGRGGRRN